MNKLLMRSRSIAAALGVALLASVASAGTFSSITIDDDYSDWAAVPNFIVDPVDTTTGPDIEYVQVANDATYLYIRIHYATADSFPTYIAIDNDNSTATGFDVFGLGVVGSEAAYADDFDFDQRGGFNIGTLKDPQRPTEPDSGSAILSSFVESTDRELAIYLNTTFDPFVGAGDVFPSDTFTLMFYSLDASFGQADVTSAAQYTLAVPEASSVAMLGVALSTGAVALRRRRRS